MRMTRRQILAGAGGVAAGIAVPSVLRAQAKPYAGQTLTVFTYAGAYETALRKHLIGPFEQRTGARVVLDPGWWDMLPKLKASPPGQPAYDLVMTDPTQGQPALRSPVVRTSCATTHRISSRTGRSGAARSPRSTGTSGAWGSI